MKARVIASILVATGLITTAFLATPLYAAPCQGFDCIDEQVTANPEYTPGNNTSVGSVANVIVDTLLYFIGAIAIIMLIYGGIQYTISSGDATKAKKAKDTILYAVIGLVVALLAYAIVNFVIDSSSSTPASSTSAPGATPRPQQIE